VILNFDGQQTPDEDSLEDVLDSTHGNFTALVVDATTGKERTLHGELTAENAGQAGPAVE